MSTAVRLLAVFFVSARMQIFDALSQGAAAIFLVVQPAALLVVSLLPLVDASTNERVHMVVGVVLTSFWTSTVWGAANILRRERELGTLSKLLAGVVDSRVVVLGKASGSAFVSISVICLTVTITSALLHSPIPVTNVWGAFLGMMVALISGASIGLLIGSVFIVSRHANHISSALMYPVFILGGMLIPVSSLPVFLRPISWAISLSWLQDFLTSTSVPGEPHWTALVLGILLTCAYATAGVLVYSKMSASARKAGTLELV